jgi:hypothetical protein
MLHGEGVIRSDHDEIADETSARGFSCSRPGVLGGGERYLLIVLEAGRRAQHRRYDL